MSRILSWLVPADQRQRFMEEWSANAENAFEVGIDRTEVLRAARRAAMRMRVMRMLDTLTGRRGAARTVMWWLVVLATGVILPLGGLLLMLLGLVCQVCIVVSRRSRVLGAALGLQVVALGVAIALWNVGFDLADAGRDEPSWVVWWLPALGMGAVAFAVFWITALAGPRHDDRPVGAHLS